MRLASPLAARRSTGNLANIVEAEIIPRLMQAHKSLTEAQDAQGDRELSPSDQERTSDPTVATEATEVFARMVLTQGADALRSFIDALADGAVSVQSIYADLLRPTARLLCDLWDQDRLSYTEVTIGLGRLQQLVHSLEWESPYNGENDATSRSVLFAPRPGEQQTFGFYIMEEFFRWSGWRAWIETCSTNAQMASNAQFRWFDMFCLNVCRDTNMEEVSTTIQAIRRASRNQDLFVLVYGRPFVENSSLFQKVGADAAASNAGEALKIAEKAVFSLPD
jgi:methanogenic corrinoid protein MtbC1